MLLLAGSDETSTDSPLPSRDRTHPKHDSTEPNDPLGAILGRVVAGVARLSQSFEAAAHAVQPVVVFRNG
jgi:hypothetical protein